jgi:hypothetical protein
LPRAIRSSLLRVFCFWLQRLRARTQADRAKASWSSWGIVPWRMWSHPANCFSRRF